MKIKSFTGKSYSEALDLVKKEFGPDAVILETEEIKGKDFIVKITAAVDYDSNYNYKGIHFSSYLKNEIIQERECIDNDYDLSKEIREIKDMLMDMKSQGKSIDKIKSNFFTKLGIKNEFIKEFMDINDDEIYEKMSSEIKAGYKLSNGKTVMLVGPTGVGKTTTIIKLASFAVKIGKKVGIINLDSFRLGAFEQMRVFCQLLGIPFCSVNDVEEFKYVYSEFSKNKNIIFIDTTGRNPKDKNYLNKLGKIRDYGLPVEVHLTVSLSMQDEIFIKAKENYQLLGIDYIIFTKLDEAYSYGSIYNIFKVYDKPISYLTNGQRIPNDIQAVSPSKLTNLILRRGVIQ